ncbi:MAG: TetR/AcrR family transcriptional regulator [Pseudomonadota bacterium]
MNMPAIRTESDTKPPLGRADWLRAALETFITHGVDAVQITKIAKQIGMTRGSFYWHFQSRDDLLSAMLKEWQAANSEFFNQALANCETLDQGVLSFFKIWVGDDRFNPNLDQAIRDWARLDDKVLDLVREEDNRRIMDIANMYARFDFEKGDAEVRARVLYFTQVGYTSINLGEAMSERLALLEPYYLAHTGRVLDKKIAEGFRSELNQ